MEVSKRNWSIKKVIEKAMKGPYAGPPPRSPVLRESASGYIVFTPSTGTRGFAAYPHRAMSSLSMGCCFICRQFSHFSRSCPARRGNFWYPCTEAWEWLCYSVFFMAIPANVIRDASGQPLKLFSTFPLKQAEFSNVFSQMLTSSDNAYVFPPFVFIGPLLRFLSAQHCTVPDICPRRHWWPLLLKFWSSLLLGTQGDTDVLRSMVRSAYFAVGPVGLST